MPRWKLLDNDKFGVTLDKCNRRGGAVKVLHVQKEGHYHNGAKITLIFAVEPGDPRLAPHVQGSVGLPQHWIGCVRYARNTTKIFCDSVTMSAWVLRQTISPAPTSVEF